MITPDGFTISSHAILRYMERVLGVDVNLSRQATQANDSGLVRKLARWSGISLEAPARQIFPDHVRRLATAFGDGNYPAGTHTVRVRDRAVVTIVT